MWVLINQFFQGENPTVCEDHGDELHHAWDDVSGKELNPTKVRKARQGEASYIHETNLHTKVPRSKAKYLGQKVISVRWIGTSKGDNINEDYRNRLVSRKINTHARPGLFAATPPLGARKLTMSMMMSGDKGEKLMVNDVGRAFFCAPARRQVLVELPHEDKDEHGMIGELTSSMYGTRDAAQNWGEECAENMVEAGFARGNAPPCIFYHRERGLRTYIHGGGYVAAGKDSELKWLKATFEAKCGIKTQILGKDHEDCKQVKVSNRRLTLTKGGIAYEADPRHAEIVVQDLGLKDAKGVVAPGTKEEGTAKEYCQDKLSPAKASEYRAIAARLNYLSPDRRDIRFSVK